MVIADPDTISSTTAATPGEGLNVGDCNTDSLSSIYTVDKETKLTAKIIPSRCSGLFRPSSHLRLQHGAAHVGPRLPRLCDHQPRHRHGHDLHHQVVEHQGDSVRVRQPDGSRGGLSAVPH